MRARVAVRAPACQLTMRARVAVRAAVFQLPMRAGVAVRAAVFHLAMRAGVAVRALAFQPAMRAGVAVCAAVFPLAMRTRVAVRAVAFPLAMRAGVAVLALLFHLAMRTPLHTHREPFTPSSRKPRTSRVIQAGAEGCEREPSSEGSVRAQTSFSRLRASARQWIPDFRVCRRRVFRVDRHPSRRHFLSRVVRDRSPLCARCRRRLPPPTPRPPRARPLKKRRSSSSARRRRRPRNRPRLRRKRRSSRRGRFAASPAGPSPSGWCSTLPSSSSPPQERGYVPNRFRIPPPSRRRKASETRVSRLPTRPPIATRRRFPIHL